MNENILLDILKKSVHFIINKVWDVINCSKFLILIRLTASEIIVINYDILLGSIKNMKYCIIHCKKVAFLQIFTVFQKYMKMKSQKYTVNLHDYCKIT